MLLAQEISKSFHRITVLHNITLSIPMGSMTAIVGQSGSGKTTLLNILSTLDRPDRGSVTLYGRSIHQLPSRELARFRNKHIGLIFQSHNLLPELTLYENICLPGYIGGLSPHDITQRANWLVDLLDITHCVHTLPLDCSGGERQRAAVARALINNPDIIFADEPSGSLDSKNAKVLHEFLFDLAKSHKQTIIYVTHNIEFSRMADHIFHIQDGILKTQ